LLPLPDARLSSLFRDCSHASRSLRLTQTLTGIRVVSGSTAKTAASPLFRYENLSAISHFEGDPQSMMDCQMKP
jgi:hypothetical protein